MKLTKRLNRYIIQLPILGFGYFASALFLGILLFTSKEYWSIFYLPFKLFGEFFGYYVVVYLAKGGSVNYYFTLHKANEEEKALDRLIIKYNNNKLITLTAVLFVVIDIILVILHTSFNNRFIFGDSVFLFLWTVISVGIMCEGVKYMTAWWNIWKNWKKEFGDSDHH